MSPEGAINQLARAQHGVFTRAQARELGATDAYLKRRLESGAYLSKHRGVYAVTAVPPSWEQSVMAFCLTNLGALWAARRTAARLWEMPGFERTHKEFCSVGNVRSRGGIKVRRLQTMPACDSTRIGPIPTTSPTRTLLDVASIVEPGTVELALDYAIRKGLTSISYLARRLDDLQADTNIRGAVIRKLIDERPPLARLPESPLETLTIQALRSDRLPIPSRQHEIWHQGSFLARVDLAYPTDRGGDRNRRIRVSRR